MTYSPRPPVNIRSDPRATPRATLPLTLASKRIESVPPRARFINILERWTKIRKIIPGLSRIQILRAARVARHFITADVSLILHKYLPWASAKSTAM